uniref:SFRICE_027416 n=1 Tax=Spodoptera frugiperda TaxID=7108 RepID=A0A2H1VT84_SPOFR
MTLIGFFILKRWTLIILFSAVCEKFYMAVSETDAACSRLLQSTQNIVEIKRFCKNVQRLNRASFHKMTACHIFTVDGRLPQEFIQMKFGYILVLLQFLLL